MITISGQFQEVWSVKEKAQICSASIPKPSLSYSSLPLCKEATRRLYRTVCPSQYRLVLGRAVSIEFQTIQFYSEPSQVGLRGGAYARVGTEVNRDRDRLARAEGEDAVGAAGGICLNVGASCFGVAGGDIAGFVDEYCALSQAHQHDIERTQDRGLAGIRDRQVTMICAAAERKRAERDRN